MEFLKQISAIVQAVRPHYRDRHDSSFLAGLHLSPQGSSHCSGGCIPLGRPESFILFLRGKALGISSTLFLPADEQSKARSTGAYKASELVSVLWRRLALIIHA